MRLIWLPISSLVLGALIGSVFTFTLPITFAKYLSVAILAALDSVLGGIRSILEDSFDSYVMLTGFFTNALLAAGLAFLGDKIGVDMYLAATVCFGLRLFSNLGYIRRFLINKLYDYRDRKRNQQKAEDGQNTVAASNLNPDANIINQIIENNTSEANKTLEFPESVFDNSPTNVKGIQRSKTNEAIIEDMIDEDMKEYVKIRNRKHDHK